MVRDRCHCGASVLADDDFCERCGAALVEAARDHVEAEAGACATVSDRGLVHARNEDAVHVAAGDGHLVAVVCDGVSTCAAPDVASAVAATSCADALAAGATVRDAVAAAGAAVQAISWSGRHPDGPSTTIVAARTDAAGLHVAWVGDSRAYWVDDEGTTRLTTDHSLAEERRATALPASGIAADEHMITRWREPQPVRQQLGRTPLCRPRMPALQITQRANAHPRSLGQGLLRQPGRSPAPRQKLTERRHPVIDRLHSAIEPVRPMRRNSPPTTLLAMRRPRRRTPRRPRTGRGPIVHSGWNGWVRRHGIERLPDRSRQRDRSDLSFPSGVRLTDCALPDCCTKVSKLTKENIS